MPRALGTLAVAVLVTAACSSRKTGPVQTTPTSNREVGTCAAPDRDGVVGASPQLERFEDRDLDGDGVRELVVVDRSMCTGEGNCYWNLFSSGEQGCVRYVGTVSGASMQVLADQGDRGFRDLRAWWRFDGGERLLVERYRFRHGGYRTVDALLCRRTTGTAIRCAPDSR